MKLNFENFSRLQYFLEIKKSNNNISTFQFFFLKHLDQFRTFIRQIEVERLNKEDWNIFHICLTLLQNIGMFFIWPLNMVKKIPLFLKK